MICSSVDLLLRIICLLVESRNPTLKSGTFQRTMSPGLHLAAGHAFEGGPFPASAQPGNPRDEPAGAFSDATPTVIQHRRRTVPALADDLEVGELRLPEPVDSGGLVLELVHRPDHHIDWAGDKVAPF
jgi:hypothetical protein